MRHTLTGDLRRAFGVVLAMIVLVGGVGAVAVHITATDTRRATDEVAPALQANADVLHAVAEVDAALRGYVISADSSYLGPYRRGLTRLAVTLDLLDEVVDDARGSSVLATQQQTIDRWLQEYAVPRVRMPVGPDNIDQDLLRQNLRLQSEIRADNASVRSHLQDRLEALATRSDQARAWVIAGVVVLAVVALGIGALTSRRTIGRVRRPLAELQNVLRGLAAGDHAARVRPGGPDEIARIGVRVNELADETDRMRAVEAEELRLQERLVAFSRSVRGGQDDRDLMAGGMAELGSALGLQRAYVRMIAGGSAGGIEAEWHAPGLQPLPEEINQATPGREDELTALLHRVDARVTPDVSTDPVYASEQGRAWARLTGAAAAMAVPVHVGAEAFAVISLIDAEPRVWTPAEVHLAESVAADLGRALADSRLYASQVEALDRLNALDKAKDDFVSGVSHELRTPLTSIGGYLELLEDDLDERPDETRQRVLAVLRRNVDRLRGLIEDLLALSRVESGGFHTEHREVDVVEVIRTVLEDIRPQAASNAVRLCDRLPSEVTVLGDRDQLCRALLNLVSNGVKFTPPGGSVELTVDVDEARDDVRIRVQDTGIGIPAADQPQLFQRFFRAGNAVTAEVPGTGLGLAIVRTIADNHDGSVTLDSVEGRGTTATLRIPRRPAATKQ